MARPPTLRRPLAALRPRRLPTLVADDDRPRTARHVGPSWVVEALHVEGRPAPVAAKRARRAGFHAAALLDAEAAVADAAHHPRLVRPVGRIALGDGPALCLAPCCPGTVGDVADRAWSPGAVTALVRDVAGALAALHGAGWVHGRVDAGHVLVDDQGRAVLAGLGGARGLPSAERPDPSAPAPADDVAALARLALDRLEPTGTDPGAIGLRSVLRRMAADDPARRPTAATAAELAVRFGPPPGALPVPPPPATAPPPPSPAGLGPPDLEALQPSRDGAGTAHRPPRRGARRARRPVAAGLAVAGLVLLGLGARAVAGGPGAADGADVLPACPLGGVATAGPGVDVLAADVDGRGCTVPVRWDTATGEVEVVTDDGIRRYALGAPGDQLQVADWDCDGVATPLLVRPGQGQGWVWDRWPTGAEAVAGRAVALDAPGRPPSPC